jgi:hypothetical protein
MDGFFFGNRRTVCNSGGDRLIWFFKSGPDNRATKNIKMTSKFKYLACAPQLIENEINDFLATLPSGSQVVSCTFSPPRAPGCSASATILYNAPAESPADPLFLLFDDVNSSFRRLATHSGESIKEFDPKLWAEISAIGTALSDVYETLLCDYGLE